MLVRLMYASRASAPAEAEVLASILKKSKDNNARSGITGVLCFCANAGIFLQVLEGARGAVSALYNRIAQDARHHEVVLLSYGEISERSFSSWAMGQVNMARLNPSLLIKYSESVLLDPYAVPGEASMRLFYELLATASIGAQM